MGNVTGHAVLKKISPKDVTKKKTERREDRSFRP